MGLQPSHEKSLQIDSFAGLNFIPYTFVPLSLDPFITSVIPYGRSVPLTPSVPLPFASVSFAFLPFVSVYSNKLNGYGLTETSAE